QLSKARRGTFVELVESLNVLQVECGVRLGLESPNHFFERCPTRPFRRNESVKIDDHINWRCLMLRYCDTSCALSRSLSIKAKRTPRRCRVLSTCLSLFHRKWPDNWRYTSSIEFTSGSVNRGTAPCCLIMLTSIKCCRRIRSTLRTKFSKRAGSSRE